MLDTIDDYWLQNRLKISLNSDFKSCLQLLWRRPHRNHNPRDNTDSPQRSRTVLKYQVATSNREGPGLRVHVKLSAKGPLAALFQISREHIRLSTIPTAISQSEVTSYIVRVYELLSCFQVTGIVRIRQIFKNLKEYLSDKHRYFIEYSVESLSNPSDFKLFCADMQHMHMLSVPATGQCHWKGPGHCLHPGRHY